MGIGRRLAATLLAVVLAGCARQGGSGQALHPSPTTSSTTVVQTTTTLATSPWPELSARQIEAVRLPKIGLVLEYRSDSSTEAGLVLASLDGEVLVRLPGATVFRDGGTAGPLIVQQAGNSYLVDPDRGRLVPVTFADHVVRLPLAHGGALVEREARDPGSYAIEQDGQVIAELGNMMADSFAVSYDRDMVTLQKGGKSTVIDLRDDTRTDISPGCIVADRYGKRWLLLCEGSDGFGTDVVKIRQSGRESRLFGPLQNGSGGHWVSAAFSDDGTSIAVQWSGECESPSVFMAAATGGALKPLPAAGIEASAAGWTGHDEAVVVVPWQPGCGEDGGVGGVHLITGSGQDRTLFGPDQDGLHLVAGHMWMALPS